MPSRSAVAPRTRPTPAAALLHAHPERPHRTPLRGLDRWGPPSSIPTPLEPEPSGFPGDRSSEPPPSWEGSHRGLAALPPNKRVAGRRGHRGGQKDKHAVFGEVSGVGTRLVWGRRLPSLWALHAPGLTSLEDRAVPFRAGNDLN